MIEAFGYFLVGSRTLFDVYSFLDPWSQVSCGHRSSRKACIRIIDVLVVRILNSLCGAIQIRRALTWVRIRLFRECLRRVQCLRFKHGPNRLVYVSGPMIVLLFLAV